MHYSYNIIYKSVYHSHIHVKSQMISNHLSQYYCIDYLLNTHYCKDAASSKYFIFHNDYMHIPAIFNIRNFISNSDNMWLCNLRPIKNHRWCFCLMYICVINVCMHNISIFPVLWSMLRHVLCCIHE